MASENQPKTQEEAYAQLRYLQNVYSQQYELMEDQIASYSLSIDSLRKGSQFLEKANDMKKGKTIINLGGGAYVEATFGDMKTTMVYIGAGYLLEKSVEEAKKFTTDITNRQQEMLNRLDSERKKIQSELINISYKMEAMQPQQ